MWSVVMLSPSTARTRAPTIGATGAGSTPMPAKYGGLRTYVDSSFHAYRLPVGTSSDRSCTAGCVPNDLLT